MLVSETDLVVVVMLPETLAVMFCEEREVLPDWINTVSPISQTPRRMSITPPMIPIVAFSFLDSAKKKMARHIKPQNPRTSKYMNVRRIEDY